jgi:membrane-bound serine protease (ClpP class)
VRRLPIAGPLVALAGILLLLLAPLALPTAAGERSRHAGGDDLAAERAQGDNGPVDVLDVVKVDGLLDPVMVDFVVRSIAEAQSGQSVGVLLQVDSPGAVVSADRLAELIGAMDQSRVPVSVWVGPSGSTARGLAALLGAHADRLGMAPGSTWGLDGVVVDPALLEGASRPVPDGVLEAQEAIDTALIPAMAPTIGDLIVDLPGMRTREVDVDGETRREPVTAVRFSQLPLIDSLMHAVASPAVAYLMLSVGMALLIFELFTAGVGIAGGVAAGSLLLGCYGLAVLPVRWWAVALLVLSMLAFAVDVQTGVPRLWTGVGLVLYVAGSLTLFDGVSMSWITLLVAIAGVALTFVSGIPSMVRTRFATPTIGREWMVGELGRAVTSVSPDGVVQIRQALWRATTNRATPIDELDRVRVVGIDGLVLEVEPEEGGARDYRERGGGRRSSEEGPADGELADGSVNGEETA